MERAKNRTKSRVRARVEHPLHLLEGGESEARYTRPLQGLSLLLFALFLFGCHGFTSSISIGKTR